MSTALTLNGIRSSANFIINSQDPSHHVVNYNKYNYCCNRKVWCVIDCPGFMCSLLTWALISYAEFFVMIIIIVPHQSLIFQIFNTIAYNAITFLAISSYLRAMLTDPGAVPIDNTDEVPSSINAPTIRCRKCGCIKPYRAHHCSICRRCIRKMDHHCPWINNCVGEYNRKFFVLFNFYTALMTYYTGILTFIKFMECAESEWMNTRPFNGSVTLMLVSIVALEAFIFGLFTTIIGVIQMRELVHDRTFIDKLKNEDDAANKTRMENCRSVFGPSCISWFSPFTSSQRSQTVNV